jgi:hypothetical protein
VHYSRVVALGDQHQNSVGTNVQSCEFHAFTSKRCSR